MTWFRLFLIFCLLLLAPYSVYVIAQDGLSFLAVAVDLLSGFAWPGQFTLDFGIYLGLSVWWLIWRNGLSGGSIALACAAGILGALVLLPYLIYLTVQSGGDALRVVAGDRARRQSADSA